MSSPRTPPPTVCVHSWHAATYAAYRGGQLRQLSNTNNRTRPSNAAATDSLTVLPGCWVMPSTAATASGTAARSVTAASSKTQTPSGNSSARCEATSVARRILPTHQPRSMSPIDVLAPPLPDRHARLAAHEAGDRWPQNPRPFAQRLG